MSKHRENKIRKTPHIVGFKWPSAMLTQNDPTLPQDAGQEWKVRGVYNKPITSGGGSVCTHCGVSKIRETRTQGESRKGSRTRRDGCRESPGREHIYATEIVARGWSSQ